MTTTAASTDYRPGISPTLRVSTRVTNGQNPLHHGARPPADLMPPQLVDRLAKHDALVTTQQAAHTERQRLADPDLDRVAAEADADAAAQAQLAGKKPPSPTAHRDRLASDRRLAADAIATVERALELSAAALAEARAAAGSTVEWRHVVEGIRRDAHDAVDRAALYVNDLARIEALDEWLAGYGNAYNPRTRVHVADLVTEVQSRGIHRDTAGTVDLLEVLARLRDDIR